MPFTASGAIYNDPPGPLPALAAGALLRELTDADIAALLAVGGPQQNIPFPKIELRHLGGAFGRAPGGIDAVSGRHGAFAAHVVGMLTPETAAVTPQITEALLGALAPAAAGGQQVNFARPEARATDVWGPEVLGRLSGIKAAYDPGNVFRGPLSFSAPIPAQSTPG